MAVYSRFPVGRTIAVRLYPKGTKVRTPTGRHAVVAGHLEDGRLDLRYTDGDGQPVESVSLPAHLVNPA